MWTKGLITFSKGHCHNKTKKEVGSFFFKDYFLTGPIPGNKRT